MEVKVALRSKHEYLTVSLERPAEDIKNWAKQRKIVAPILLKDGCQWGTNRSIGPGDWVEAIQGARPLVGWRLMYLQIGTETKKMWFFSETGKSLTILRIEHCLGFTIDWTRIQMDDGTRWDGEVHDERLLFIPEPIRAEIIWNKETLVTELGRHFPHVDLETKVRERWDFLQKDFYGRIGGKPCENLEKWPDTVVIRIHIKG
jgi:hypothetical protein